MISSFASVMISASSVAILISIFSSLFSFGIIGLNELDTFKVDGASYFLRKSGTKSSSLGSSIFVIFVGWDCFSVFGSLKI